MSVFLFHRWRNWGLGPLKCTCQKSHSQVQLTTEPRCVHYMNTECHWTWKGPELFRWCSYEGIYISGNKADAIHCKKYKKKTRNWWAHRKIMKYVTYAFDTLCPAWHSLLKEAVHSAFPQPEFILKRYSQKALWCKDVEALFVTTKIWK